MLCVDYAAHMIDHAALMKNNYIHSKFKQKPTVSFI